MKVLTTAPDTSGSHPGFYRTPCPLNTPIIHSGNSLTDGIFQGGSEPHYGINYMLNQYAGSTVGANAKSTIPGSKLNYRWEQPTDAPDARLNIDDYAVLCITDLYSVLEADAWAGGQESLPGETYLWVDHAWTNGNSGAGAETFLWCTHVATDDADQEASYQKNFEIWAAIQDYCNSRKPAGQKPVRLIPGSWLWHKFFTDQQNGLTPTATWYDDLFVDPIHQNDLSHYLQTVLHIACLYGIDPSSLPASIPGLDPAPTTADLAYIRQSIKQVVRAVKRSGVDTSGWT